MILVTGATGHLGQATIQSLLQQGVPASGIAAMVRDEAKASQLSAQGIQLRTGDYNQQPGLLKATEGIEKLLLISSSDVSADRFQQHKNIIDAAKENGVAHIIYTSIDLRDFQHTAIPFVAQTHYDTAAYLKASGIPYTLLNNNLYADLIPHFAGQQALEKGIFFPAGEGKTPFTPRVEMGAAAAAVLTGTRHENKEYSITAGTAYSFTEIASIMSGITGRPVAYLNPDKQAYIDALTAAGVHPGEATFFAGFGEAISNGELNTHRSDLEHLLGRKPMDLETFLRGIYKQ